MEDYSAYRMQTILGIIQSGIIVASSFLTGVFLKAMHPDWVQPLPLNLLLVRNWGFLLILIPLAWAGGTIWMERNQSWSKRWTLVSGLCLAAGLVLFMIRILALAVGGTLVSVSP